MNYAILKLFENGDEYDAEMVMAKLAGEYAKFRAFKKANVIESLMSAEKNEILEQSRYELDDADELHIYYKATEYGAGLIKQYIKAK
jgi:methyl coenzyme M reductase beta subunit